MGDRRTRIAVRVTRRIVALFDGVLLTESERAAADEVFPLVLAAMEEGERLDQWEEARRTPLRAKPRRGSR